MSHDIVLEGRALLKGELVDCCVAVKDGRIAEIKKVIGGSESLDFSDNLLLPAAVDMHVHMREPGKEYKEDFFTGTMAAAFGGVSCVIDMPNTIPMTTGARALKEKHLLLQQKANVDYGLWGLLAPGSDVAALSRGTVGLKFYMSETTGTAGTPVAEWSSLSRKSGEAIVAVHPEHPSEILPGSPRDLEDYNRSRPPASEARAIKDAGALFGNVHMCHVSSREGLLALLESRRSRKGGLISAEVAPHHLLLNAKSPLGAMAKVNPPVRAVDDQAALWVALANGQIDAVATDHAPHTVEEKREDFWQAPSGIPGVETGFPLMLRAVKDGRLTLERCIEACCEWPAKRLGLKKGRIEVGYDADIVAVHMRDVTKIKDGGMHSKCGWTPYSGMEAIFPKMTMVRGSIVMRNGSMAAERGGRPVPIPSRRSQ